MGFFLSGLLLFLWYVTPVNGLTTPIGNLLQRLLKR